MSEFWRKVAQEYRNRLSRPSLPPLPCEHPDACTRCITEWAGPNAAQDAPEYVCGWCADAEAAAIKGALAEVTAFLMEMDGAQLPKHIWDYWMRRSVALRARLLKVDNG